MRPSKHVPKESFAAVIKAFLDSKKFERLAPATQRGYRRMLNLAEHPDCLGGVPVEVMRPSLVQDFLDGMDDTPGAQQLALTALQSLEKWAIMRDLLPRQITLGTEIVGSKGGHLPWTDEQIALAESVASPYLARAITLGANLGQRGSDLILMRWTDIEIYKGRPGINVTPMKLQGRVKLWVPFTRALIDVMETWEREPGFILKKPDGSFFENRQQLTDHWHHERQRPELESVRHLHIHGLRGAAVVRLKRSGATIPEICAMIGMTPKTIEVYCRFSVQAENAVAAVARLDDRSSPNNVLKFHKS